MVGVTVGLGRWWEMGRGSEVGEGIWVERELGGEGEMVQIARGWKWEG